MIYKLASHIHFQGSELTKTQTIKEVSDSFSEYDIILLTVHSQDVSKESYSSFIRECEKHSTTNKLIIPCLEDESNLYHLLLVGATDISQNLFNPDRGYLTVLAHPFGYGYYKRKIKRNNLITEELDGVEVWNMIHNSKKYPSLKTLNFFKKLSPKTKAYLGLDDHPPYKKSGGIIFVNCKNLKKESVLKALKEGSFYSQFKDFSLSSNGEFKKDNKTINNYTKIKGLIHEGLIYSLSLLTYIGDNGLELLNVKKDQKLGIIRFVSWLRKSL